MLSAIAGNVFVAEGAPSIQMARKSRGLPVPTVGGRKFL
jgi:hypothetical protein